MKKRTAGLLLVMVIFLGMSHHAEGFLLNPSLEELASSSDVVITGRVVDRTCFEDSSNGMIYSHFTVNLERLLAGEVGAPALVVEVAGGTVEDLSMGMSVSPQLHRDEDVLLFLRRGGDALWRVICGARGKFKIVDETVVEKGITVDEFSAILLGEIAEIADLDDSDDCVIPFLGMKWDAGEIPVPFWANPTGTSDCDGEFRALVKAGLVWNRVQGSCFAYSIGGFSDAPVPLRDGKNQIAWQDEEEYIVISIAYWYTGEYLLETDVLLNEKYKWSNRKDWCPKGELDVQNSMAHYMGHALGLATSLDPDCSEATMYTIGHGEIKKRTLEEPDRAALRALYPE